MRSATSSEVVALGPTGVSSINLKNIKDHTLDFEVRLHNYGKKSKTYQYYAELNTDTVENGMIQLRPEKILDTHHEQKKIEVAPQKEVTVHIHLTVPKDKIKELQDKMPKGFFLEGYVLFDDADAVQPAHLSIPFVGFYGDFQTLPVLEESIYDLSEKKEKPFYYKKIAEGLYPFTHLSTSYDSRTMVLGEKKFKDRERLYHKDWIAISPNGDQKGDNARFYGVFMRNYRDFHMAVYRAEDTSYEKPVWKGVGNRIGYGKKNAHYDYNASLEQDLVTKADASWDGKDEHHRNLPEGAYHMVVWATPDHRAEDTAPQKMILPIQIDTTKPSIAQSSFDPSTGIFKVEAYEEDASNIRSVTVHDRQHIYEADVDGAIQLPKDINRSQAKVVVCDNAFNEQVLSLENAIISADNYRVKVQGRSPWGDIKAQDIQWHLETAHGQKVDANHCEPGQTYYLIVDAYDTAQYQLVGDKKRAVNVKEGQKDHVVTLQFLPKAEKNIYFDLKPSMSEAHIVLIDQWTGKEYPVKEKLLGKLHIAVPISRYTVKVEAPKGMVCKMNPGEVFDGTVLDLTKQADKTVTLSGSLHKEENPQIKSYQVTVITDPADAQITIHSDDGREMIASGRRYQLKAGQYQMEIRKKGYKTQQRSILVSEDMTFEITLDQDGAGEQPDGLKHYLNIATMPKEATVQVVDLVHERTVSPSAEGYVLPSGSYRVDIGKEGYVSQSHRIELEDDLDVYCALEQEAPAEDEIYPVTLTTTPLDAQVVFRQLQGGSVMVPEGDRYSLPAGRYQIEVRKDGYITATATVHIESALDIECILEQASTSLERGRPMAMQIRAIDVYDGFYSTLFPSA